jgi:hypothetical protein
VPGHLARPPRPRAVATPCCALAARAGSPCPPADHWRAAAAGWLQLLPLLFFLLYSLLSQTSSPVALLRPEREYRDMLRTVTHSVPFYVRDADSFESRFPEGGAQRLHLEKQVRACCCVLRAAAVLHARRLRGSAYSGSVHC